MPRTGGIYTLPHQYKAVSGQTIRTEQHNPPLEDIAQAITDSAPRDGSAPMTGNLPMGGNKITGVAAGTEDSDVVRRDQVTLFSAWLASLGALSFKADKLPYATGAGTAALTDFTYFARSLLDDADAKEMRSTLGLNFAGGVMAFAMSTPPSGWLECDGSSVSRTTYSQLFSAIGTDYGSGDGSTTFNLPDLRGEFVRGWDHGKGVDSGRSLGSSQGDMISQHKHAIHHYENQSPFGYTSELGTINGFVRTGGGSGLNYDKSSDVLNLSDNDAEDGAGSENRPRNVSLMYCIKF